MNQPSGDNQPNRRTPGIRESFSLSDKDHCSLGWWGIRLLHVGLIASRCYFVLKAFADHRYRTELVSFVAFESGKYIYSERHLSKIFNPPSRQRARTWRLLQPAPQIDTWDPVFTHDCNLWLFVNFRRLNDATLVLTHLPNLYR